MQVPPTPRATKSRLKTSSALADLSSPSASPPPIKLEKTTLSLQTAMGLYQLAESELFTELQLDTRCLMAWSSTKIVVSFRGTASMKNAKADLQVSSRPVLITASTTSCQ